MAHVIARRPGGPRGDATGGDDTYNNLILLCPTHHTEIDKAPDGTFPPAVLLVWKKQHEMNVREALETPSFATRRNLAEYIHKLLMQNHMVWRTYGPEANAAQANPLSNLAYVWSLRKLDTVVPNNRQIVEAIRKNADLFDSAGYEAGCEFIEHAEGFELNCYERVEGVPRFPTNFAETIEIYVNVQPVFGSFLTSDAPSDLDVLLLYDPEICDPKEAYCAHATFVDVASRLVEIPLDITLLTHMEAHGCCFIELEGCVPFRDVEDRLTDRRNNLPIDMVAAVCVSSLPGSMPLREQTNRVEVALFGAGNREGM